VVRAHYELANIYLDRIHGNGAEPDGPLLSNAA